MGLRTLLDAKPARILGLAELSLLVGWLVEGSAQGLAPLGSRAWNVAARTAKKVLEAQSHDLKCMPAPRKHLFLKSCPRKWS